MDKIIPVPGDQVHLRLVTGDKLDGEVLEADDRNVTLRVTKIYDPLVTVDKLKIVLHTALIEEITKR